MVIDEIKKKERGLAYISDIRAIIERMYSEEICKDFGVNTGAIATENGLQTMETELRKKHSCG